MTKKQTAPVLTAEQIAEQEAVKLAQRTAFAARLVDRHAEHIAELEAVLDQIDQKDDELRRLAAKAEGLARNVANSAETLLHIKDEGGEEWPLPPTMLTNATLLREHDQAIKHLSRLEAVGSALRQLSRYF